MRNVVMTLLTLAPDQSKSRVDPKRHDDRTLLPASQTLALGCIYAGIEKALEDSLAAELLPHQVRGTGYGTMAVVNGIGDFISSLAVGWLWMAYGSTAGFAFGFALMTVGSAFLWRIRTTWVDAQVGRETIGIKGAVKFTAG